jgi:hypothetical protein
VPTVNKKVAVPKKHIRCSFLQVSDIGFKGWAVAFEIFTWNSTQTKKHANVIIMLILNGLQKKFDKCVIYFSWALECCSATRKTYSSIPSNLIFELFCQLIPWWATEQIDAHTVLTQRLPRRWKKVAGMLWWMRFLKVASASARRTSCSLSR